MNTSHGTEREGEPGVVERVVGAQLYDALFGRGDRVAILLEPDGRVVDANPPALALGDLDRDDVVGATLPETPWFAGAEARAVRADIRCAAGGTPVSVDRKVRTESGVAVLDVSIQPIAPAEDAAFLLFAGVDVTDRERRITTLERQTERLDEFVRVVSRDLRTPLRVASSNLAVAAARTDLPALARAERSLDRAEALLAAVHSVASDGHTVAERTSVDLDAVARAAWDRVATPDATLQVESTTHLSADETRLVQLFENLFRNAVEHGPTGPPSSSTREDGITVRVGACEGGFYVADDGTGLPENAFGSVFEAGVTTASDGTGVGLSVVESIVLAHGWAVEAGDAAAGGARFDVRTDPAGPADAVGDATRP